jgi:hypothetical protein
MTSSFASSIADVTIASGTNASRAVFSAYEYSDAVAISIQAPGTLDALTFTLEGSQDGTTWATLNDGTADLPVPAAGKIIQYTELLSVNYWRIKASGNTAADRTFKVTKQWTA